MPPAGAHRDVLLDRADRDTERVPFAARLLVVRGEQAWFANLHDLSAGGCGIFRTPGYDLPEEEVVRLCFHQDGDPVAMMVAARVARVTEHQVGIEYHEAQAIPPRNPAR